MNQLYESGLILKLTRPKILSINSPHVERIVLMSRAEK